MLNNITDKRAADTIASIRRRHPSEMSLKELAFINKYGVLTDDEKRQVVRLRRQRKMQETGQQQQQQQKRQSPPRATSRAASNDNVSSIEDELYDEYGNGDNVSTSYVDRKQPEGRSHAVARGSLRAADPNDDIRQVKNEYAQKMQDNERYENMGVVRRVLHLMRRKKVLVIALVLLFLIFFVFRSYIIPSESMYPTLKIGDRVVGTAIYFPNGDSVDIGDVVCFYPPGTTNEVYVKRVIAKGGDHVQISGDTIYVNGEVSPYGISGGVLTSLDFTVSDGCYWMAGDNGSVSADSRVWGELPADRLICKLHAVYWPIDRAQWL